MIRNFPFYTYKGAALRVDRSVGQIKQWVRDGLKTSRDGEGRVIIAHEDLMAEYRARMRRNPVHQARLRADQKQRELDNRPSDPPNV